MLPKIKRFIKKYKKQVTIGAAILIAIIVFLILFKSLFYSSSEKSVYGVRIRGIKENEFTNTDKKDFNAKVSDIAGVKDIKTEVKGRLIKVFVTFNEEVNTDDIKLKFNEMSGFISDNVKGYYDITFYAIQNKDEEVKYSVIGYKHKSKAEISFEVL